MTRRDKYKAKIEKNQAEMQPTYDAYAALDSEINAELEAIEQKKRNAVYEHVMSVFGEGISAEDFAREFDKLMSDNRNRDFVEHLKQMQKERKNVHEDQPPSGRSTS